MDWHAAGRILYAAALVCCGSGGGILIWMKHPEMENRATLMGYVRAVLQRTKELTAEQNQFFTGIRENFRTARMIQLDMELYDSSLLLKNMALAEQGHAFSADYIYERLMEHAGRLKPVYAQMLTLYRSGKDEAAFQLLAEYCGSRAAKNFSMILSKLDRIQPDALVEQMEVFQEIMGQQRMTAEMKRVQRHSLITTVLATAVVFVMVIDFAVVIVFMHTLTMMEQVF